MVLPGQSWSRGAGDGVRRRAGTIRSVPPAACVFLVVGLWAAQQWRRRQHSPTAVPLSVDNGNISSVRSGPAATPTEPGALTRPPAKVGPSLLAGDLANLAGEAQRAMHAGADFLHLDIFDGHWIRGAFTFGPMVVKALRAHVPTALLDAHLCVTGPERYVEALAEAGVDRFTFHVEAVEDPQALAKHVHALGMQAGLALAPSTPLDEDILALVPSFDVVLVMTVQPGFGGQHFLPEVLPKLAKLRSAFPGKALEVDGGVSPRTVKMAAAAGANEAVAGTAVFRADDPVVVIQQLREGLEGYGALTTV
mmetsp:Transcript_92333/g.214560  ORF Transcript_92333/g.214560 Transcript_92333/m.214560 type:complete len:308 (+) Transcript_92333:19-942(+)